MAGQENGENEIDNIYSGNDRDSATSKLAEGAKTAGSVAGRRIGKLIFSAVGLKALLIALAIAIIFIVIVGIVSFILMGPESIRGKFIELVDDMWASVKGIFIGKAEASVKKEQIVNVAQYLDNMGYKLEGYGFGDVKRDDNGKVTDIDSKYLLAYLAAENKTYMIANDEFNFSDFFRNITDLRDGTWGSGMIVINQNLWNTEIKNVSIDRKAQTMNIHMRGSNANLPDKIFQYNLDGWMGRYGKPIEFLLALHVGTMAPDFAYQVAVGREFDTKVYVKFKKVGVTTRLRYTHNGINTYVISYDVLDENGKVVQKIEGWDKTIKKATDDWRDYYIKLNQYNAAMKLPLVNVTVETNKKVKEIYGINMQDVEDARKYEKDHTYWLYKPYIIGVTNHWFRDLDFSKAYVQGRTEKINTGTYNMFQIEEERDGEIYQKYEPRIVGKDKKITFNQLLNETKATTSTTPATSGTNSGGTTTNTPTNDDNKKDDTQGKGNLPLYHQDDGPWEDYPYPKPSTGEGTIAYRGCGPTSIAMIATWATGKTVTPDQVAQWLRDNGYCVEEGTDHGGVPAAASHWEFTLTKIDSQSEVIETLKSGIPVLAAHGPGMFTGGGHFIVYAYLDGNGNLIVNDPNSNNGYDGIPLDLNRVLNEDADWWIPSGYKVGGKVTGVTNPDGSMPGVIGAGSISTVPGNEYEGHRLDELFKDTYYIANGIDGLSKEKKKIDAKNTMRYALTMLENVHSEDANCILRDLKRYLSKRGFVLNDEYVITNPSIAEEKKSKDDDRKLEYEGTAYVRKGSQQATSSGGSNKPLGGIFDDPSTGGVEVSEDDLTIILHHKSSGNSGGFETGVKVKSPCAGEVVSKSGDTIRIRITTSGAQGKIITISGFDVSAAISQGARVSMGQEIGRTTDSDITVTMEDEQTRKPVSPKDYLPIISADQNDVEVLARLIEAEAGSTEGRAAVAWCIIHRKNSSAFPNTIYDVIYQSGQFSPTWNGSMPSTPSAECLNIARNCLSGTMADPVKLPNGESLYFLAYNSQDTTFTQEDLNNPNYYYCGGNMFSHTWFD